MSMQSSTDWVADVCAFSSSFASYSKTSGKITGASHCHLWSSLDQSFI